MIYLIKQEPILAYSFGILEKLLPLLGREVFDEDGLFRWLGLGQNPIVCHTHQHHSGPCGQLPVLQARSGLEL